MLYLILFTKSATRLCVNNLQHTYSIALQRMHDRGELARSGVAEQAVEEQGGVVRSLKEGQGLDNSSDTVQEAVAELLKRKDKLQQMKDQLSLTASQ